MQRCRADIASLHRAICILLSNKTFDSTHISVHTCAHLKKIFQSSYEIILHSTDRSNVGKNITKEIIIRPKCSLGEKGDNCITYLNVIARI